MTSKGLEKEKKNEVKGSVVGRGKMQLGVFFFILFISGYEETHVL